MEYVGQYVVMLHICMNITLIESSLEISGGTNAEVMPAQWEFQVSSQPIQSIQSTGIKIRDPLIDPFQ